MTKKTMLNIKINEDLKNKAKNTAKEMGLPLSIVVNNFLKQFVEEKRLTFTAPLIPNAKTRKILDEAMGDIKAGKNMYGPFETVKEENDLLDSFDE